MHVIWTFRSYLTAAGNDRVARWHRSQTTGAQAAFAVVREYLEVRERDEWRRPEFDKLSGRYKDLGELRFEVANVQYRPLGFFGPARAEFTILVGATKKGATYDPPDALETALKRRKEVLRDSARSKICDF